MKFDEYQAGALSTECAITPAVHQRFVACAVPLTAMLFAQDGLQFADELKKHIFYGRELSVAFQEESALAEGYYTADSRLRNPSHMLIRLVHAWLGIVSEIPEIAEAIVNNDTVNIGEESGDVKYYLAVLDDAAGFKSSEIAEANRRKLLTGKNARYRHGFSEDAAVNRNVSAEQEILSEILG